MALRSNDLELDGDFEYVGTITKAQTRADGTRLIRGVASGLEEDRDGERVSRRALQKMAAQPTGGGAIKLTSSHQQDWVTEFGDVVKVEHDTEHDELLVDCVIPPAGEDPIADKAWKSLTVDGKQLGFSIGGKLRKGYYELVSKGEGGKAKRRKVLDDILLRHVALTEKPSYRNTFAQAVAKTFTGDEPADDGEFFEADEDAIETFDLTKAAKPTDPDDPEQPQGDTPQADPPAATADTQPDAPAPDDAPADDEQPAAEAESDDQADQQAAGDLPKAGRHLACPNCGHEFAADLPPFDQANPETPTDDDAPTTGKSQETTMDTADTLEKIRALADSGLDVAKDTPPTDEPAPEPAAEPTDGEALADTEIGKLVAATHANSERRFADLEKRTAEGFDALVDVIKDLQDTIHGMPQGRRSVARVPEDGIQHPAELQKSEGDTDDDLQKAINDPNTSFVDVLKVKNRVERGIR